MAAALRRPAPGLALLVAVAAVAHAAAGALPRVDALVVAVGLGVAVGNLLPLPDAVRPGIEAHKLLLETGIVLLGVSVSVQQVAASGPAVVALVLSRRVGLSARSGSLLAAGASICGVSAVAAVGRGVDADRETLAYAAGAVLALYAVTLVAFPVLGGLLGLPDRTFGVWAGLSMFSTGPVAAAGFAHSPVAGRWATLTKLVRNALLGVVATGYAVAYAREGEGEGDRIGARDVWREFPKFLVGFVVVALAASAGLLSPAEVTAVETAGDWLFALAFAGVGLSIRVEEVRAAGLAPVAVLVAHLAVVSALALAAAALLL
ncbi:MAG: YeiH family protein [Halobacteriaceae archaeon]